MAYRQIALKLQTNDVDLTKGHPNMDKFLESLADDLNTANALMELYNVIKEANQLIRSKDADLNKLLDLFATLKDMFYVLGLDIKYVEMNKEDKEIYNQYLSAKNNQDYAKSDELRKLLVDKGIM